MTATERFKEFEHQFDSSVNDAIRLIKYMNDRMLKKLTKEDVYEIQELINQFIERNHLNIKVNVIKDEDHPTGYSVLGKDFEDHNTWMMITSEAIERIEKEKPFEFIKAGVNP